MRPGLVLPLVAAGVVALGIAEAALGVWSEQAAAAYPVVAHLRMPILTAAVGFCAAGQVALLVATRPRRAARIVLAALLVVMASLAVAIQLLTASANATPPLVGLGSAASVVGCLTLAAIVAFRARRPHPGSTPAARAGSA